MQISGTPFFQRGTAPAVSPGRFGRIVLRIVPLLRTFKLARLKRQRASNRGSRATVYVPDAIGGASERSFEIDFAALERRGFIGRPTIRRKLSRDMRALRHRLLNRIDAFELDRTFSQQRRRNVVMVSSAWAGEGKTFTAVNLTLSLILEGNFHVLLIDANIGRSDIEKLFNIDVEDGVTEFLNDSGNDLAEYLWRARNGKLTILPAGGRLSSPWDLFRGDRMSQLLDDVSTRYPDRIVIIDSPAMLASGDAVVLANHADHIVMVVQAGRTAQSALEDALDMIVDHEKVSLVLNRCNEGDRLTNGSNYSYG